MKVRILRDRKPVRAAAAANLAALAPPQITIIYRRSIRVAEPIAIKDDAAAPKKRGFSRGQILADSKAARRY